MINEYNVKFVLRDGEGKEYTENMQHMTLSDFEVVYENIFDEIVEIHMEMVKEDEDETEDD